MEKSLTLLNLRERVRGWFRWAKVTEIPQYPEAISHGWYHPDFFASFFEKGQKDVFSFQVLKTCTGLLSDNYDFDPGIIWLSKPYKYIIEERLSAFFDDLQKLLLPGSESHLFSLSAVPAFTGNLGEKGCSWQVTFNGINCGNLHLITEIVNVSLGEPVAVLSVSFLQLMKSLTCESVSKSVQWSEQTNYSDFIVSEAYFENPHYFSGAAVKKELENVCNINCTRKAIGLLMARYIILGQNNNLCDQELNDTFLRSFKKVIQKHCSIRTEGRKAD